jgi:hypothetical protein
MAHGHPAMYGHPTYLPILLSAQVVAALEGLRSGGALFSASVDAVCELVWVSVDPESGMVVPLMMPLVQVGDKGRGGGHRAAGAARFASCLHIAAECSKMCNSQWVALKGRWRCSALSSHTVPLPSSAELWCLRCPQMLKLLVFGIDAGSCAGCDVPAPALWRGSCTCCS